MATQITNYQCPSCTGPLHFSAATGYLECEYCRNAYNVADIEAYYAEKNRQAVQNSQSAPASDSWDTSGLSGWGEDAAGMKAYNCPSCGAQLICEETTAATACPYCGNPTVVPGQFAGELRPDYVIPFKLTKEAALAALKQHYKGKIFLPGAFRDKNTIEKIQGVYVPFWLYDGQVSGDFCFKGTTVRTYTIGDEEITETSHYDLHRSGSLSFEKVPVDASSKMPDAHMDSIEPFDYSQLTPFSTAYLPGFLADKYDVSVEESNQRADQRCINTLEDALKGTLTGYGITEPGIGDVTLNRGKVHYALLPVWVLNVKWNNQDFLFTVNGQTGKTAGNLPVSKAKLWGLFAAIAAPLSILGAILAIAITG